MTDHLGEDCDGDDLGDACVSCESDCTCGGLGACCTPDGECLDGLDRVSCELEGNFQGSGTICADGCPLAQAESDVEPGLQFQNAGAPTPNVGGNGGTPGTDVQDEVLPFSGEFVEFGVDLWIRGRGLDLIWARRYRSKIGPTTALGNGWDFSYNIFIEQSGPDIVLHDGNTRVDTYLLQPNGTWVRDEFFREFSQNPDGSHALTFSDTGTWNFHPFDGSPREGRISSSTDRNGNTLTFDYDAQGRLITIHDTLDTDAHNRDFTISYNSDGFIESLTDYTDPGRQVKYEYYQDGDAGGSFGDLKSVTTPTVTGTPNGNDFPSGKTTIYTYSTGFGDDRLNHNLLTITDPKEQTYLTNIYAPTQNPNSLNFDRIVRQSWGDPGDIINYVYVLLAPVPDNNFALIKCILNDRVGNVKEYFYDAGNRNVIAREYTGRADPDQPTTNTLNRPTGKLRPADPDFFETRYEWNDDSLITRITHANLNEVVLTYDSANPSRRARGNLLQECLEPGPLGGDQAQICESFEYDPIINNDTNFLTRHVDGRGNATLYQYDVNGNRTHTQERIPSIVEDWEYNAFGQVTAHILPDNGSNHRRRDEYTYYDSGPQLGYLRQEITDGSNFALTTTYEYDPVGNLICSTDPRGHDTQYVVNQLDQTVRTISREVTDGSGVRYEHDTFYDANDNVVRIDIQNKDDQGVVQSNTHFSTIYEYEILNFRSRMCEEVGSAALTPTDLDCSALPAGQSIATEYEYDANRNRTLVRYGEAANGNQPANVERLVFDERDLDRLTKRVP